jgi:hypothetical protein
MYLSLFNISALITLILIGWFKTLTLQQYSEIFNIQWLQRLLKWDEYKKEIRENVKYQPTYFEYIRMRHYGYWAKMLSCPICFSVWLSIFFSILFGFVIYYPIINILSLIFYYLIEKLSN